MDNTKNKNVLAGLIILLGIIGLVLYATSTDNSNEMSNAMPDMQTQMNMDMHTELIALNKDPQLDVEVYQVYKDTADIKIKTSDFMFAPEHANGIHILGEGHAHVYVDGVKIGRAYDEWFHIIGLAKGAHVIKVTLNTNDHHSYAFDSKPAEKEVVVNI